LTKLGTNYSIVRILVLASITAVVFWLAVLTLLTEPMILVNNETLQAYDPTSKPTKGVKGHYYATVEVHHQLHCLDITRKFIWREKYGHVVTFQDPPDMVWEHIGKLISIRNRILSEPEQITA
jgi:hypothetical protein